MNLAEDYCIEDRGISPKEEMLVEKKSNIMQAPDAINAELITVDEIRVMLQGL